ncbi:hypothetical protein AALP_AAs60351U000100 [Arabis alpina]|uniref:RING-type domain-containing protein n=1 Tax=Arabis alpina TaxID=50452 RepID=A0A087FZS4_ARAAL|nr:hypothetical protein AALP_AAs60351U000100 [Arabis alpina]
MNETSIADKKVIMKCFTCLICNNLFDQATTITECLHSFCRKCIHDKITEENLRACPVCNVDLGEQSNHDAPLEPEKLAEEVEAVPQIQSSAKPLNEYRRRRKNPMPQRINDKEGEMKFEILLNIEQDNRLVGAGTSEGWIQKEKNAEKDNEELPIASDLCDQKLKGKAYSPPVLRSRKSRDGSSAGTSQNAISNEVEGRNKVWFSLAARKNQHTDRPLQEIPTVFLHVNGNLPVSYVKKYVANKLNLESEDEVEIWIRTEPVCSTQLLHTLVDWWVQTTPISEQRSAMVGSSGEDFVMKLYYSRSHLYP